MDGLREAVAGRVIAPGEDGYDAARVSWQRKFDPRPAVIVEAAGVPDVAAAIRFAREHDLPLTVQATGHGTVRAADDGLLLRTGAMTSTHSGGTTSGSSSQRKTAGFSSPASAPSSR